MSKARTINNVSKSHGTLTSPPPPKPPAPNSHLASLILMERIAQRSKVRNFWANPPPSTQHVALEDCERSALYQG